MESEFNIDEIELKKKELFKKEILNIEKLKEKINLMYENEYKEIFKQILIISKEDFMSFISNGVKILLIEIYGEENINNKILLNLQEELYKEYEKEYLINYDKLNKFWKNLEKEKNDIEKYYLTNFRKHCCESLNYAFHNCQNEKSKFIKYEENNKIKYVICIECQIVYFSNCILCYCSFCNKNYYSSILSKEEKNNLFIATWEKYHCEKIINEKMKCLKCKSDFYINVESKNLICLKCNLKINPNKIVWTCKNCKKDFKSKVIIYNPIEYERIKKIIQQTLNIKHRAHPKKIPCCKLNIFNTEFFHQKNCNGILYEGELDNKIIIVCEKCNAVNFNDKFIWTCPKCFNRFRDKVISKKKYCNNKVFNHLFLEKERNNGLISDRNYYNIFNHNYFSNNNSVYYNNSDKKNISYWETESNFFNNNVNNNNNNDNNYFKKCKSNLFDILVKRKNSNVNLNNISHNYYSNNNYSNDISLNNFISDRKDKSLLNTEEEKMNENYFKINLEELNEISKKLFEEKLENKINKKNIDLNNSEINNEKEEKKKQNIKYLGYNKYRHIRFFSKVENENKKIS